MFEHPCNTHWSPRMSRTSQVPCCSSKAWMRPAPWRRRSRGANPIVRNGWFLGVSPMTKRNPPTCLNLLKIWIIRWNYWLFRIFPCIFVILCDIWDISRITPWLSPFNNLGLVANPGCFKQWCSKSWVYWYIFDWHHKMGDITSRTAPSSSHSSYTQSLIGYE